MKILILLSMFLLLNGCFGPTLFTVGKYNVTMSDMIPKTTLVRTNKEKQ